ncbi:MAG: hypothetical protein ACREMV_00655, partial [Gemmatimonadales bacterium]
MGKHTEARLRRIARIKELQRIIEQRMKHWLAELEGTMRTPGEAANQVCRSIARELQKMRPHADDAELPSFAELAGSLAVLANRPRSLDWKLH